jgi:ornithine cyclodeaminase/alanine dehydrogenase-like protein (mu-crystallin family)
MTQEGWNISSVSNVDDLLQYCTLIVTTTCAREPYLGIGWMGSTADPRRTNQPRPLHITCIGSDSTGKQEVDNSLILHAQLLVCDSRLQTTERGEYEDVIKRGMIDVNKDVIEIGELAGRKELHRQQRRKQVENNECGSTRSTDTNNNDDNGKEDNRLTIFDSSGVAVQDCVIACMVYEALLQQL